MGTSKPLTIWVHPDYYAAPWVQELIAKGHVIMGGEHTIQAALLVADLILGPNCCRWVPGMEKHLDALLKGARAVKFPKKEKAG